MVKLKKKSNVVGKITKVKVLNSNVKAILLCASESWARIWAWLFTATEYITFTLHYKLFIVAKVKKLQGPLWRKSHNNVRIWLPK